jgi:glucans biosynthesis protein C
MQTSNRHTYLDWLRIAAIMGVLFYHSAMPFAAEEQWHIRNTERSNLLMEAAFFLSRFRMPLLFFISGAVAFFMLQRRTATQFIGLRFRRLFVPLLFGMLTIVPVQVYMERLASGYSGNFLDFYPTIFTTGPYPQGNMSWHHLWFIAYLFVYDVVLAPVFAWCVANRPRLTFFEALAKGNRTYWILLLPVVCHAALTLRFPQTNDLIHDWNRHLYWAFFLLCGFLSMCVPGLVDSLARNRRTSLTFAVLTIFILNYLRWNGLEPDEVLPHWQEDPRTYLYFALYALTAWLWVFALVGYGKRYLGKQSPALGYMNKAVYPFYILHQTVIVVIAYYVVQTTDTVWMKYGFTVLASFLVTMFVYHLFVRPFPLIAFFLGAKKEESKVKEEARPVVHPLVPQVG